MQKQLLNLTLLEWVLLQTPPKKPKTKQFLFFCYLPFLLMHNNVRMITAPMRVNMDPLF